MDVDGHVTAFNAAVASGDWVRFVARFTDDAELVFVGPPVGPFVGRAAITQAYEQSPPDDTIETTAEPVVDGPELVVAYRWSSTRETGTMRFTAAPGGRLSRLVVTFD